jgi:hypothetical protein
MAMQESEIIDQIYSMYEGDVDLWETTSPEYKVARAFLNAGVNRWRYYERTDWKELFTNLSDATTGSDVTATNTFVYATPDDFVRPTSYVKVGERLFKLISPSKSVIYRENGDTDAWCYFGGNEKTGYSLYINPLYPLAAGQTIDYSYYRKPTEFTTPTSVTEMSDPYFLVHYVLYRLYKNDSEAYKDEFTNAEARLEQMRTNNIAGIEDNPDEIEWNMEFQEGFGY